MERTPGMISPEPGSPTACRIAVKAVPGSKRDQIVGRLGDRLKIKVAAPPEDGRANEAICRLLAKELGVGARDVAVISGFSHPEKIVRVLGKTVAELEHRW